MARKTSEEALRDEKQRRVTRVQAVTARPNAEENAEEIAEEPIASIEKMARELHKEGRPFADLAHKYRGEDARGKVFVGATPYGRERAALRRMGLDVLVVISSLGEPELLVTAEPNLDPVRLTPFAPGPSPPWEPERSLAHLDADLTYGDAELKGAFSLLLTDLRLAQRSACRREPPKRAMPVARALKAIEVYNLVAGGGSLRGLWACAAAKLGMDARSAKRLVESLCLRTGLPFPFPSTHKIKATWNNPRPKKPMRSDAEFDQLIARHGHFTIQPVDVDESRKYVLPAISKRRSGAE